MFVLYLVKLSDSANLVILVQLLITYIGNNNAKQKHLGCKKARPIRSSSYLTTSLYIAILATKNFDIKVRPRIS